jgi:hypothetical protein
MRKLVVLIVALFALFTFIRDFPSATPNVSRVSRAAVHSSVIP